MIDIKAILKKHNITREDMLRNDWQVKILDLLEDAMTDAVAECDGMDGNLVEIEADICDQISLIKEETKPIPEAWDK